QQRHGGRDNRYRGRKPQQYSKNHKNGGHRHQQSYRSNQQRSSRLMDETLNGEVGGPPSDPPKPVTAEDLANINLTDEEKKALSSKDLKSKDIQYIITLAEKLKIENAAGMRRQDI